MAYAVDPAQEQQAQQPGTPGAPGTAATAPVTTSAAPGAGPSGGKAPTGAASTQQAAQPFTNLQSYLSANAPQIQQQATNLSTGLTNQYGQVMNDIGTGTQAFNSQVASGYTPENQGLVQSATTDPTAFVQTPGNTQAFQSQINDTYTGPANFEGTSGYQTLNNEVTQDTADAALLNSPSGVQQYLQGTETNPTQGENLLDSVLLDQSPQAIQQIQGAAAPFSQLPTYLSNDVTTADQGVTAAQTGAQQAAADANAALGNTVSGLTNSINTGAQNAENAEQAYDTSVGQFQQTANPMEQAINSYLSALPQNVQQQVPNFISGYESSNQPITTPIDAANFATPDQYAEAAALQQLGGGNLNLPISQGTISQAGTAPTIPTSQLPSSTQLADLYAQPLLSSLGNAEQSFNPISPGQLAPINSAWDTLIQYLSGIDPSTYQVNGNGGYYDNPSAPTPTIVGQGPPTGYLKAG